MMTNRNIPVPGPQFPSVVLWGSLGTGAASQGGDGGGCTPLAGCRAQGSFVEGGRPLDQCWQGSLPLGSFPRKRKKPKPKPQNARKTFRVGPVTLLAFPPSCFKAGHGTRISTGTGAPAPRLPPEGGGEPGSLWSPTASGGAGWQFPGRMPFFSPLQNPTSWE